MQAEIAHYGIFAARRRNWTSRSASVPAHTTLLSSESFTTGSGILAKLREEATPVLLRVGGATRGPIVFANLFHLPLTSSGVRMQGTIVNVSDKGAEPGPTLDKYREPAHQGNWGPGVRIGHYHAANV
jgi:hypothetical protein